MVKNMKILFLAAAVLAQALRMPLPGVSAGEPGPLASISPALELRQDNVTVDAVFTYASPAETDVSYRVLLALFDSRDALCGLAASDSLLIEEGEKQVRVSAPIDQNTKRAKAFVWTDTAAPLCAPAQAPVKRVDSLKVLAVGNSFSSDAIQWVARIARDRGVSEVILGNLAMSGCSLSTHWDNARYDRANYTYYKNTTGTWTSQAGKTMLHGLTDEAWDIITLQQASPDSGISSTYSPLPSLMGYVNQHKTNPAAKLVWHMTWAYQADSTHSGFASYQNNQLTMYQGIVQAVQENVLTNSGISYVIPAGTAIQNVRTSLIGDTLTRDGYHLSLNLGRYIAGLTWFAKLTGLCVDHVTDVPNQTDIPPKTLSIIKESVAHAIRAPFTVTPSAFPPRGIDLNDYTLLEDLDLLASSYWNSSSNAKRNTPQNSAAENLKYFISTKMFTKSDLPNGSLIMIESGYQYRPEGWITLQTVNAGSARPGNVSAGLTEVTGEWWGSFQFRAFNISKLGSSTDISGEVAQTASRFKIYVPKQ